MKLFVFKRNLHNSAAISKPRSLWLENVRQKMRVIQFNKNGERNIVHYILPHWLLKYSDSCVRELPPHSDRQDGNVWHTLLLNSASESWEDPVSSSNLDLSHSSNEQEGSDIVPVVFTLIVQICSHRTLIVLVLLSLPVHLNETEVITGIKYFHVPYELEYTVAAL